jgi:hypothetical protein
MGDQLPAGVSYVVFDGAANSGVGQSVKWLQRALGPLYTSGIDGDMGAGTLGAVQAVNDCDASSPASSIGAKRSFAPSRPSRTSVGAGCAASTPSRQLGRRGPAAASGRVLSSSPTAMPRPASRTPSRRRARALPTRRLVAASAPAASRSPSTRHRSSSRPIALPAAGSRTWWSS